MIWPAWALALAMKIRRLPEVPVLRDKIRAAISNAYYEARNAGETMETAADDATLTVLDLIKPYVDALERVAPDEAESIERAARR